MSDQTDIFLATCMILAASLEVFQKIICSTMPAMGPASEKYAVYTVASDDESDDSHTSFKEREELTPAAKSASPSSSSGLEPFPSIPSDMSHWGKYWTSREKCCCVWNILMILSLTGLGVAFVYINREKFLSRENFGNTTDGLHVKLEVSTNPGSTSSSPGEPKICNTLDCVQLAANVFSRMKMSVDPCEDFYGYSCGGFETLTPLSWQMSRIRQDPDGLVTAHDAYLTNMMSSMDLSKRPGLHILRSVYQACVGSDISSEQIKQTVRNIFTALSNEYNENTEDRVLARLLATAHRDYGASPLFSILVLKDGRIAKSPKFVKDSNFLSAADLQSLFNKYSDQLVKSLFLNGFIVPSFRYLMPSDFYYRDQALDRIVQEYVRFYTSTIKNIIGTNVQELNVSSLENELHQSVTMEIRLQQAQYDEMNTNLSDEISSCKQRMRIGTLQRYHNGYKIDWKLFFSVLLQKTVSNDLELCYVDLSSTVAKVISDAKFKTLQNFIKFHTILNSELSLIFQNQISIFTLSTSLYNPYYLREDLESNCLNLIKIYFPVTSTIESSMRQLFEERSKFLFKSIKSVLVNTIDDIYWIPFHQRNALVESVRKVSLMFEWSYLRGRKLSQYYSKFPIMKDMTIILHRALKLKYNYHMSGTHIARSFVNSLSRFDHWNRELVISHMAVQIPVIYNVSSTVFIYGSTGSFMAQALAQLFDIDALLNHFMTGLINQEVVLTFAHHLQCLITYYGNFTIDDHQGSYFPVKSDVTKSANLRDNLAIFILYQAYRLFQGDRQSIRLPALKVSEDQLFFILYSQTMCESINSRGITKFYRNGQHINGLPSSIRIRGMMSNFPEFSRIFDCPKRSPYNPEHRCGIV